MRARSLALAVAAVSNVAALVAGDPQVKRAVPGDTARGLVLKDDGQELQLDATPCHPQRTVIVFHRPYTREAAGSVHCQGADRGLSYVIQK